MIHALDHFLAQCLRSAARGEPTPPWPPHWPTTDEFCDAAFARIAFHGIALALLEAPDSLSDWPASVRDQVRSEARLQTFWEQGHRMVLTRLVGVLGDAGVASIVTKGSALAYSVYPEPSVRRRGDSDLLLGDVPRKAVRKALKASGFRLEGDARPLQESWASECPMGFTHVFDLHWRINASAVIAQCLERGGIGTRLVPLPRLCDGAQAIAPGDNLVLVAINRASHETFGYQSGEAKVFDQDRLIWALDIALICKSFTGQDWHDLLATAQASGTSPVVFSALAFAEATLGLVVPTDVKAVMSGHPGDAELLRFLGAMRGIDRLRLDLSASQSLIERLRIAAYTLFPSEDVLRERFPDATRWPLAALQLRRLLAGAEKLLARRS